MKPVTNLWYGVDALVEKYPNLSSYNYCANNPVKFIDKDGNYWFKTDKKYFYDSSVTSQEDATNKYGKETKYLFAAGTLFAKSGAYSYNLEVGGHVKKPVIHWIFYKDADNMDKAKEGIMTKTEYQKLKK